MDGAELRSVVLQIIDEVSARLILQPGSVLQPAIRKLGIRTATDEQALLTFFYDLFRIGYLSWGGDMANPSPPFFHVTGTKGTGTKASNPLLAYKPYGVLQVISGSLIGGGLKYLPWALLVAASDLQFSAAACIGGNQESDFYF